MKRHWPSGSAFATRQRTAKHSGGAGQSSTETQRAQVPPLALEDSALVVVAALEVPPLALEDSALVVVAALEVVALDPVDVTGKSEQTEPLHAIEALSPMASKLRLR
jgi:hypothetical protein